MCSLVIHHLYSIIIRTKAVTGSIIAIAVSHRFLEPVPFLIIENHDHSPQIQQKIARGIQADGVQRSGFPTQLIA